MKEYKLWLERLVEITSSTDTPATPEGMTAIMLGQINYLLGYLESAKTLLKTLD